MKRCSSCQVTKPLDHFGKDSSRRDSLCVYCRECLKEKFITIRKKHNTQRTNYNKNYRRKNKEKYNEWERANYRMNSERLNENAKRWRDKRSGTIRMLHLAARARAAKKNLVYDLNPAIIDVLLRLQNEKCILTEIPFKYEGDSEYRYGPFKPSLDRKDNNEGYTLTNVQITLCVVNKAKNEYTQELFDLMCTTRAEKLGYVKI